MVLGLATSHLQKRNEVKVLILQVRGLSVPNPNITMRQNLFLMPTSEHPPAGPYLNQAIIKNACRLSSHELKLRQANSGYTCKKW